jgi:hypothetical protein
MTSTPDLNIDGSPIYESLVATTGDPYQPPAYQVPDVYGAGQAGSGAALAPYQGGDMTGAWDTSAVAGAGPMGMGMNLGGMMAGPGGPAMLSQLLGRMMGDGQSWCAIMIFGGPAAEQMRGHQQMQFIQSPMAQSQFMQPAFAPTPPPIPIPMPQVPQYAQPAQPVSGTVPGYDTGTYDTGSYNTGSMDGSSVAAMQAYQQAYQWAAQQQAMMMAAQQGPLALTAGPDTGEMPMFNPAMLPPAEETQAYNGMLGQDWSGWLGQTSQARTPEPQEVELDDPYERRGGMLGGRLGAAMRELRGK